MSCIGFQAYYRNGWGVRNLKRCVCRFPDKAYTIQAGLEGHPMFCARCGLKVSQKQKFCRSCGNRLQTVPPALDQDPKISRKGKNAVARAANDIGTMGAVTLVGALAVEVILGLIGNIIPITAPEVFGRIL